ncbi:hypothetical protein AKJ16_DCAP24457, partial [Drosera capensis]
MAAANDEREEDWEHLHSSSSSSPFSSSSSSQPSSHNLSIFPPINHESLPLLLPPPPPHSPQPSPPPPPPSQQSTTAQFIKWVNLATHMLNSKACRLCHWMGSCGVSSLSRDWWGSDGGVFGMGEAEAAVEEELILKNNDERVERLMNLIREKDEEQARCGSIALCYDQRLLSPSVHTVVHVPVEDSAATSPGVLPLGASLSKMLAHAGKGLANLQHWSDSFLTIDVMGICYISRVTKRQHLPSKAYLKGARQRLLRDKKKASHLCLYRWVRSTASTPADNDANLRGKILLSLGQK